LEQPARKAQTTTAANRLRLRGGIEILFL